MLEIACFNPSSAIAAAKAGADRIELCADYAAGGVTPPHSWLLDVKRDVDTPVNVMIRPRGGNFVYSGGEFEIMKTSIRTFKPGASGFVFGILNEQNEVDVPRNKKLIELAAPLPCTFHRAIDLAPTIHAAGSAIVACGFKWVLTSGGEADANAGAEVAADLQNRLSSNLTVILGGGVRSRNIQDLKERSHLDWYHSAAITTPGEVVDEEEVARLQNTLTTN
ncbi:copper homeostasis CutC domain-containing protein [Lophiotrema nucula]|uniref:Copper homeostasis protein cutC homolog n=1 Tax=Lophiotrema nucula TaxID=690887 RepID=A0A6A5Z725_9PLEO|nr:copper homeostasis CutC domain-containing protein [Lophiotrema nucula]